MKENCSTCKHSLKKEGSYENDIQDDWVSCDIVYVETRELLDLSDFKCNYYEPREKIEKKDVENGNNN